MNVSLTFEPEFDALYESFMSDPVKKKFLELDGISRDKLIVICTVIWAEGISIKSLNNVIIASGGLDPKTVLQKVGRGTRLDEGKTEVTIWDFMDNYRYLSNHSIARMELYAFSGWKINIVPCVRSKKHKDKGVL